jgi:transposase-like protein
MVECPECNEPLVLKRNISTGNPYYKCYECDETYKIRQEYHELSDEDLIDLEEDAVVY